MEKSGNLWRGQLRQLCPPFLRLYAIWRLEPPESGTPSFSHGEEAEEEKIDNTVQD